MEENAKQEKEDIEARKLKAEEKLRIVRVNRDHQMKTKEQELKKLEKQDNERMKKIKEEKEERLKKI